MYINCTGREGKILYGIVAPLDQCYVVLGRARKGEKRKMISRIWHGWTTRSNADKYEAMLKEEIFVGIENRHIRGFKGIQLLRREVGEEIEFVTIMLFDSLEAVREFAGDHVVDHAAPPPKLQ